ncbi:MAG: methionine synthase [Paludibacteraceae bacterium]|nr:methionine synthase [Paludibacteraceae bacterium]
MKLILDAIKQRVLVLDGAMGTMLQRLTGAEYDKVKQVHQLYIEVGADIISTHTFVANEGDDDAIVQRNVTYGQLARQVADAASRKVYVAGSIGPSNKTLTLADQGGFDELCRRYSVQIKALRPYVDVLLFETFFDTLNLKAALVAAKNQAPDVPVMVSVTLEKSGRLLSGQTLEALVATVEPFSPMSIGLNCSFGAADMLPHLATLSSLTSCYVSVHPNAGLPNALGEYDETPASMAQAMQPYFDRRLVNIVGGCCGTTPQHIALIGQMAAQTAPRIPVQPTQKGYLTGLETLCIDQQFVNVGERTNVAGSKKFARLIAEKKYDEALTIARKQVEGGALVIDVCMDDAMLDASAEMAHFLFLMGNEPTIARVPVMIDSSRWEVLAKGLQYVQGKAIVNSISLKEGEEVFLERASYIQKMGAAVVVMAFDEEGQATTYAKRIQVCHRAYQLLTEKLHFPPQDIVFDPNVLTLATGMPEHNSYGVDFIETVRYIKQNLPHAKVSGGISNLSFAFRGNNVVREAMHSVFLYHAIQAGLDMAIVNPAQLQIYSQIEPTLLAKVEAVILNTHPNATDGLIAYAKTLQNTETVAKAEQTDLWRSASVQDRLVHALMHGITEFIQADVNEALQTYRPIQLIEEVLMKGMTQVGKLFGEGKMFLPQVVKTAQVMKKAVSFIEPLLQQEAQHSTHRPKVLLATVKGDVHDIGKNIVGVVLACNGYDVIDLGVMVPKETIVRTATEQQVVAICLSGLITPSLVEMAQVATELQRCGSSIPLVVGGATTSLAHTALKLDPLYSAPVLHSNDASHNVALVNELVADKDAAARYKQEYAQIRAQYEQKQPIETNKRVLVDWQNEPIFVPTEIGAWRVDDFLPLKEVASYINWKAYAQAWKIKFDQAGDLIAEAKKYLFNNPTCWQMRGRVGIFPAISVGETIEIGGRAFPMERRDCSLADFVSPHGDYVGAFAVTVDVMEWIAQLQANNETYAAMVVQLLADRLVEACSEYLFETMKNQWWGFDAGIRPAVGYPCLPNHQLKQPLFDLLEASDLGITLTESGAMLPQASVCGLYLANKHAKYF